MFPWEFRKLSVSFSQLFPVEVADILNNIFLMQAREEGSGATIKPGFGNVFNTSGSSFWASAVYLTLSYPKSYALWYIRVDEV